MTYSEAIDLLKQRNQRYAQKHGINDYVRQSEQIINAFIACANKKNGQLMSKLCFRCKNNKPKVFLSITRCNYDNAHKDFCPYFKLNKNIVFKKNE